MVKKREVEFIGRVKTREDGIVVYSCFTFDELSEEQINRVNNMLDNMTKRGIPIRDYSLNGGYLFGADGKFVTGCFATYNLLSMLGAIESTKLYILPVFPEKTSQSTKEVCHEGENPKYWNCNVSFRKSKKRKSFFGSFKKQYGFMWFNFSIGNHLYSWISNTTRNID